MDLRYTDAEEAFRRELRAWLAEPRCPGCPPKPDPNDWPGRRAYDTHWQRLLFDAGYAGVDWPVEGGGRGRLRRSRSSSSKRSSSGRTPPTSASTSSACSTPGRPSSPRAPPSSGRATSRRSSGATRSGARASPSPTPGSDLASLRTRAVRDGDDYVVTGSKIWTSHAEVADNCELLVRTGAEDSRHRGITWLILPMDTPGVEIRPLRTIAGSTEFAELFLDEVRVPVGQPGGRRERRLAGDHGHPQLRAGHRVRRRPARGDRAAVATGRAGPAHRRVVRPGRPPAGRPPAGRARRALGAHQAQRLPGRADRHPGHRRHLLQAGLHRDPQRLGEFSLSLLGRAGLAADDLDGADGLGAAARPRPWSRTGCGASPSPSPPAPRRSSATSSANASSACRRSPPPRGDRRSVSDARPTGLRARDERRGLRTERVRRAGRRRAPPVRGPRSRSSGSAPARRPSGSSTGRAGGSWARPASSISAWPRTPAASGSGLAEAALVFEELGRALVPGPLVASHLAAGLVDGADDGSVVVGLVEAPGAAAGRSLPVVVEHLADLDVLLVALRRRHRLARPARSLDASPARRPMDPLTPVWSVAALPGGRRRSPVPTSPRWWRRDGAVLTAALQVGAGGVDHRARGRVRQAAPAVRSARSVAFQAVKHLCADMAVRTEVARCAVQAAAVTVDQPDVGDAACRGRRRQAAGRRGGARQRAIVHPGARRDGVHLGGPRPPRLQAGPGAGHPVRDRPTSWPSRSATRWRRCRAPT